MCFVISRTVLRVHDAIILMNLSEVVLDLAASLSKTPQEPHQSILESGKSGVDLERVIDGV